MQVATRPPESRQRPAIGPQRDTVPSHRAGDHEEEDGRARPLRDHRGHGRGADPEIEPVDEQDLEPEVQHARTDGDEEWGAGVLEPADVPRTGQREQQRRDSRRAQPQVDLGVGGDVAVGTDETHERPGQDGGHDRQRHRQQRGEPEPLHPLMRGLALVAGADEPGDRAGRPVGEEDEHGVAGEQDRRCDSQSTQLRCAEMADDGGVGEQVQRLGDQRPEGGNGESEDLPIELPPCSRHGFAMVRGLASN